MSEFLQPDSIRHANEMEFQVASQAKYSEAIDRSPEAVKAYLVRGWMNPDAGAGGLQINITAAQKSFEAGMFRETDKCDHNCGTIFVAKNGTSVKTGEYDCPARSLAEANIGTDPNSLAPAEYILRATANAREGILLAAAEYAADPLDDFAERFHISSGMKAGVRETLLNQRVQANIFGGNPEIQFGGMQDRELFVVIEGMRRMGLNINLTTTGGRFLHPRYGNAFVKDFLANPPDLIAVSADDWQSPEHIKDLAELTSDERRDMWSKISPMFGQKKKAVSAAEVMHLKEQYGQEFPNVLINMVVHPGNFGDQGEKAEAIIDTLRELYPFALINPYLVQYGFLGNQSEFREDQADALAGFIKKRLNEQLKDDAQIVPHKPYWLMLDSACQTANNPQELLRRLGGYEVWNCYDKPLGAGRYFQVGRSPYPYPAVDEQGERVKAGGHPACFWDNATVTPTDTSVRLWDMSAKDIVAYRRDEMREIAHAHPIGERCPGCSFPRLAGLDMITVGDGMNDPKLINHFLSNRRILFGF